KRDAPYDCIAGSSTLPSALAKLAAVRREPSLKRSPGRTVKTYVRPSGETVGGPAAASGRVVNPAGAPASRNTVRVAQVAYQVAFARGRARAGSSDGRSVGAATRSVPPTGALRLAARSAPMPTTTKIPRATAATAERHEPKQRVMIGRGSLMRRPYPGQHS